MGPMIDPSRHAGFLLLRVWVEGDSTRQLRCRIISSLDVEGTQQETAGAGSSESACSYVCSWLEKFAVEAGIAPAGGS